MRGLQFLAWMGIQLIRPFCYRRNDSRSYSKKGVRRMPAKSKSQLRKAGAACGRGEKWGCEMVEKTKSAKGLPEKVKGKKGKGK